MAYGTITILVCKNHGDIIVEIYFSNNIINYVRLYDKDFNYQIFIDKKSMSFYYGESGESPVKKFIVLPIDSSLNPENLSQKIKIYLTFM